MMEQASEASASRVAEERDALADFLKRAVEPHLAPRQDPRQLEWASRVDAAAGDQMRAILHHPHFAEELWVTNSRFENISGPAITFGNENNPRTEINLEDIACRQVKTFALDRKSTRL